MKRLLLVILSLCGLYSAEAITLRRCQELAEENYPLIRKYNLIEETQRLGLSDIDKTWLPKITVYGQASLQNEVPEFPKALSGILSQMGQSMKGMSPLQYQAGVEIGQTIWDGGISKSRREIERESSGVSTASVDVSIYSVRERINELFFSILLLQAQSEQIEETIGLLKANHARVLSMFRNGIAMQSDVDMIEARILSFGQQKTAIESSSRGLRRVLGMFTSTEMKDEVLEVENVSMPVSDHIERPELSLLERRIGLNYARLNLMDKGIMPKIAFFAKVYYGYPGMNYFESMRNRDLSFNAMAGVKLSWNIDSFYTRKNSSGRIKVENAMLENERDVFIFNTEMKAVAEEEDIVALGKIIEDDRRILELRCQIRRAAESQLENGVIDMTSLLSKINDENQSRINSRVHEIQLIQNIVKLKTTLNR